MNGILLAKRRMEALEALVKIDPKLALENAIPYSVRKSLPPFITRNSNMQEIVKRSQSSYVIKKMNNNPIEKPLIEILFSTTTFILEEEFLYYPNNGTNNDDYSGGKMATKIHGCWFDAFTYGSRIESLPIFEQPIFGTKKEKLFQFELCFPHSFFFLSYSFFKQE